MLFSFIIWWYGTGWLNAFTDITRQMGKVAQSFSASILLRTLFAPWRRITTEAGKGIDAQFRAIIDNLVSRLVGFTVRIMVLITAGLMTFFTGLLYLVIAVTWPLLPLLPIYCLVRVVTG